jgi:hypothetical protein
MSGWMIKDPVIFFGLAGVLVAYVLYMMIRKRKGERTGVAGHETEL